MHAIEISIRYSYQTLDHIPSSCIVVMVHMVNGHQYSARRYTIYMDAACLKPTLSLDSDRFRCFKHSDELNSGSTASKLHIGHGTAAIRMHAIY
jgi:hypothetical protein